MSLVQPSTVMVTKSPLACCSFLTCRSWKGTTVGGLETQPEILLGGGIAAWTDGDHFVSHRFKGVGCVCIT